MRFFDGSPISLFKTLWAKASSGNRIGGRFEMLPYSTLLFTMLV